MLAATGLLAGDERGEDARRHEEHRGDAREGEREEDRPEPPTRLLPLLAAARLDERVVAGLVGEAVALGVGGARRVDQAGVAGVQGVEPDPESVGDAGPEGLDHHVGVVGEAVERLESLGRLRSIVTARRERFQTAWPL